MNNQLFAFSKFSIFVTFSINMFFLSPFILMNAAGRTIPWGIHKGSGVLDHEPTPRPPSQLQVKFLPKPSVSEGTDQHPAAREDGFFKRDSAL